MKTKLSKYFILLLTLFLFWGCSDAGSSISDDYSLWSDSPEIESKLAIGTVSKSKSLTSKSALSRAAGSSDSKVYFRSSDIEFWSIDFTADLNNIYSSLYLNEGDVDASKAGYANGQSLAFDMGDAVESLVFTPYGNKYALMNAGDNSGWDSKVDSFLLAHNEINLIRMDIGAGVVSFVIDGSEKQVYDSAGNTGFEYMEAEIQSNIDYLENCGEADWPDDPHYYGVSYAEVMNDQLETLNEIQQLGSGMDANSIFFIDKAFLSKQVLINREMQSKLLNGQLTASSLGLTSEEFNFINTLCLNKNEPEEFNDSLSDDGTIIDVDGALCVPMTPIDLTGFDASSQNLEVSVKWNIANSIKKRDGKYYMQDRVDNTAFDFKVELKKN